MKFFNQNFVKVSLLIKNSSSEFLNFSITVFYY